MVWRIVTVSVLLLACAGWAQVEPAPQAPVDMTDPLAVVQAYRAACSASDVKAALALTNLDAEVAAGMLEMQQSHQLPRTGYATAMRNMALEADMLPMGSAEALSLAARAPEGQTVRVEGTAQVALRYNFILSKQADGTWRIDLQKSVSATTGMQQLLPRILQRPTTTTAGGRPREIEPWRVRNAVQTVNQKLLEYAQEKGKLPEADAWMDEVEGFSLDPATFDSLKELGDKYGVALSTQVAGSALPGDWMQRRSTVVLYVTRDAARNQSGDPDEVLESMQEGDPPLMLGLATGEVLFVPAGITVQVAMRSAENGQMAQRNVNLLARALIDYAREHGGCLPRAEEWCDAVLAYAKPDQVTLDTFRCPGRPELDYAWAMNSALSGKDVRTLKNHAQHILLLPAVEGVRNESRELPDKVEEGWHLQNWSDDGVLTVSVGTLNGSTMSLKEGQSYPRPPAE